MNSGNKPWNWDTHMSTFYHNNKKIHYEADGDGQPVLILNGIMMSTRSWEPFMPSLTEHFRVIRLDMFDQGESAKLDGETYTQDLQVDLIKGLLMHLSIDAIDLVGISYGGEVALAFAAKYRRNVRRMVLFNSAPDTNVWLKEIGRGWIEAGKTRNGLAYYQTTIPVIYSPHFYAEHVDWMEKRKKTLIPVFSDPAFLDAMERLTLSAESYDVRDDLDKIDAPTLLVSAEEDHLTPVPNQAYLAERMKHVEWVKIPKTGHASMYERPLLFTSFIIGFLRVSDTSYSI